MKDKLFIVSALALVTGSLAFACGSDEDGDGGGDGGTSSDGGGATGGSAGSGGGSAGSGGGSAGSGGGSAGTGGGSAGTGGGTPTDCDTASCEGVMIAGMELAPCCLSATMCGVSVGGAANCFPRSTVEGFLNQDGGLLGGPPETIVEDPDCPDLTFMSFNLNGCCDPSGVCGVNAMGLDQCITPSDAESLGFTGDAGADVPCDFPADAGGGGTTDAGAGGRGGGRDGG